MKFDIVEMFGGKLIQGDDATIGWILLSANGKFIAKLWKSDIEVICNSESQAVEILKTVAFAVQMGYHVSKLELDMETSKLDISIVLPCPIEQIDINVRIG